VGEQLSDGWAVFHRSDFQATRWQGAEQIEQDGVVPVPGVEKSLKKALIWCVRHGGFLSRYHFFAVSSPILESVPSRSCCVSFTDSAIEHSVQVPAESLYEAAVEAIAAFRRSVLAEMPLGPSTRLTNPREGAGGRKHGHNRQSAHLA
jgi:hypothetical protein